jgi:hypothetical protein
MHLPLGHRKRANQSKCQAVLVTVSNDGVNRLYKAGIDQIDNHVKEKYDRAGLEKVLNAGD